MTSKEKLRAKNLINKAMEKDVAEDQLKIMLCALYGHPPVLTTCFGYQYCARCGEQLGDSLGGSNVAGDKAVVGHSCDTCDAVISKLTPVQKLGTKLK